MVEGEVKTDAAGNVYNYWRAEEGLSEEEGIHSLRQEDKGVKGGVGRDRTPHEGMSSVTVPHLHNYPVR